MRREAMMAAAARLLTDDAYRSTFFAPGAEPAAHGLAPDEFGVLRRLDPDRLDIVSEGYVGKRLEHLDSAFPRTLAALEAVLPGARSRYLATTAFAGDAAEERTAFEGFLGGAGVDGDARRFLLDLARLERTLHEAGPPGLPAYRYRPEGRPSVAQAIVVDCGGALDEMETAWTAETAETGAAVPARYPPAPRRLLVLREGDALTLERLDGEAGDLLAACDGGSTVAALVERFGPEADARLRRWFRLDVVRDATQA